MVERKRKKEKERKKPNAPRFLSTWCDPYLRKGETEGKKKEKEQRETNATLSTEGSQPYG